MVKFFAMKRILFVLCVAVVLVATYKHVGCEENVVVTINITNDVVDGRYLETELRDIRDVVLRNILRQFGVKKISAALYNRYDEFGVLKKGMVRKSPAFGNLY